MSDHTRPRPRPTRETADLRREVADLRRELAELRRLLYART